jgi:ParB-like chromosome segregation protein Spo0J
MTDRRRNKRSVKSERITSASTVLSTVDGDGRVRKWKIARLKEHPRQQELFGRLPEQTIAAMAADMSKNGLYHPVEILSDGTIVAGHQRVLAAKLLGWTEIDVIVRTDLEKKGPAAVVGYLISDNLLRRQATGLTLARGIRELVKLQERCPNWRSRDRMKADIGKRLGDINTREVNRYLRVLDAPTEVQEAFDRGKLSLDKAGKVVSLDDRQKQQIAARIKSGEDARAVVNEYLARPTGRHKMAGDAFRNFVKNLAAAVVDLEERTDQINCKDIQESLPLFARVTRLLAILRRAAKKSCADTARLARRAQNLASEIDGPDYFRMDE